MGPFFAPVGSAALIVCHLTCPRSSVQVRVAGMYRLLSAGWLTVAVCKGLRLVAGLVLGEAVECES